MFFGEKQWIWLKKVEKVDPNELRTNSERTPENIQIQEIHDTEWSQNASIVKGISLQTRRGNDFLHQNSIQCLVCKAKLLKNDAFWLHSVSWISWIWIFSGVRSEFVRVHFFHVFQPNSLFFTKKLVSKRKRHVSHVLVRINIRRLHSLSNSVLGSKGLKRCYRKWACDSSLPSKAWHGVGAEK